MPENDKRTRICGHVVDMLDSLAQIAALEDEGLSHAIAAAADYGRNSDRPRPVDTSA